MIPSDFNFASLIKFYGVLLIYETELVLDKRNHHQKIVELFAHCHQN